MPDSRLRMLESEITGTRTELAALHEEQTRKPVGPEELDPRGARIAQLEHILSEQRLEHLEILRRLDAAQNQRNFHANLILSVIIGLASAIPGIIALLK